MPTASTLRELEERLRRLEAEAEVLRTLAAYAHAIDYGDESGWVDCFTPDGAFRVRDGSGAITREVVGHEALAAFIAQHTRAPDYAHRHLALNAVVELDGDRATSRSYLLVLVDQDAPTVRLFGRYVDRLVQGADGRWRFEERVAEVDSIQGPLARIGGARDPRHPVEP